MAALRETWEANLEPAVVGYNAGVRALALLGEMWEVKLTPNGISCSAGISACENGGQW